MKITSKAVMVSMLVATLGGAYMTAWMLKSYKTRSAINASQRDHSLVGTQDEVEEQDLDDNIDLQDVPRLSKKVAALARMELHLTDPSFEQKCQVKEWSVRYMKSIGVRTKDMVKALPFIIKLAFLETRYERMAREMELSDEFVRRSESMSRRYWTYELPSFYYPLGRVLSEGHHSNV